MATPVGHLHGDVNSCETCAALRKFYYLDRPITRRQCTRQHMFDVARVSSRCLACRHVSCADQPHPPLTVHTRSVCACGVPAEKSAKFRARAPPGSKPVRANSHFISATNFGRKLCLSPPQKQLFAAADATLRLAFTTCVR